MKAKVKKSALVTGSSVGTNNIRNRALTWWRAVSQRDEAPVTTTYPDGRVLVETPEAFRHRMGLKQCPRCLQWDKGDRFVGSSRNHIQVGITVDPRRQSLIHQCRFPSTRDAKAEPFQSGVDAWYGHGHRRENPMDLLDPVKV